MWLIFSTSSIGVWWSISLSGTSSPLVMQISGRLSSSSVIPYDPERRRSGRVMFKEDVSFEIIWRSCTLGSLKSVNQLGDVSEYLEIQVINLVPKPSSWVIWEYRRTCCVWIWRPFGILKVTIKRVDKLGATSNRSSGLQASQSLITSVNRRRHGNPPFNPYRAENAEGPRILSSTILLDWETMSFTIFSWYFGKNTPLTLRWRLAAADQVRRRAKRLG